METKFKDVAHLYLGCGIETKEWGYEPTVEELNYSVLISINANELEWYKPILKHLSDITEQDQAFLTELVNNPKPIQFLPTDGNKFTRFNQSATYGFSYLLSKGYDLFNLIETGQAINAKTV